MNGYERAPGGFPVAIGRQALDEIRGAYRVFGAESNLTLTVHPGPHVFCGTDFFPRLQALLGAPARPLPDNERAVAWARFVDGPESLDGTAYHWLARTNIHIGFDARPEGGDALELGWGAKADQREAVVVVNGRSVPLRDGGHWGFRWVRVPVPEGVRGDSYEIDLHRGSGQAAFLSEVRLARRVGRPDQPPGNPARHRARVSLTPATAALADAFPDQRAGWDRAAPTPARLAGNPDAAARFRQAERNGRLANEALFRCRRYVDGWLAHADPATGLIPRNLTVSRDFWNGRDSAADNYPFMVLTAALTDRPLFEGRMLEMLRTETRLTSRLDRLPDDYSFSKKGWRRERLDLAEIVFDGAEYVKDGLLPITEWLGPSPWSERMVGIIDDIWKNAAVETPFGRIPTLNAEVCGDLLQANTRLHWFTGDPKYLDWAIRLGDYFLLGTNHPARSSKPLRLVDHGCEVVNGLTELYVAVGQKVPAKRQAYEAPIHELFDAILAKGRNADGLLYSWFNPRTGEHSPDLCDTWGYDYDGFYTLWLADHTTAYRDAVRHALAHLKDKYVGACWGDTSADGFADSIEGAINLLNRESVASAADWIDSQTRLMWAIQKSDGIVEGWHGDGNFARTSLMYALWKTQGTTLQPWRADVRFGADRQGNSLLVVLSADRPWQGRLAFDLPRHRRYLHLPFDYPRINQFPEWFPVPADARCRVTVGDRPPEDLDGTNLIAGLPVALEPAVPLIVAVQLR